MKVQKYNFSLGFSHQEDSKCNTAFYGRRIMKDTHVWLSSKCILDNCLIQQYIPYRICPVVVICADR